MILRQLAPSPAGEGWGEENKRTMRDGVCNPVTYVFHIAETRKRFGRGCKPRPALGEGWGDSFLNNFRKQKY